MAKYRKAMSFDESVLLLDCVDGHHTANSTTNRNEVLATKESSVLL